MVNQAPTNLTLSNSNIDETLPTGTVIGNFITTDPDTGNTFTYSLVTGTGSTDNASFTIQNNQLKTNTNLDFETKKSYSIRVRTTDQGGLTFEKQLTISINNINEASLPIIKAPIADLSVAENAPNTNLDLLAYFDDPSTTGKVARFELYNTSLAGGIINVLLFDQAQTGAPLTVNNFLNYVNNGSYTNSFIHRSMPGFVIQGGGFKINNLSLSSVTSGPSVQNEFSINRSNLRGTIAMAKVGSDPNSATNQWFFNLADNSANLDNQNGGFTVFGQVLSSTNLAVVDAIAAVPVYNAISINSNFSDLPLIFDNPANPVINSDNNFVRFKSVTVLSLNELTFSVVSNSNPNLVNASINNNQLILDYLDNQIGTAEIHLRGTNLLGYTVEDAFVVTVNPNNQVPTDLTISNNFIAENAVIATTIGNFSTVDLNIGNTFTYSLVIGDGDTNNSLFTIEGNQLKNNAVFDYETKNSYSIRVKTTDQLGLSYEKVFTIGINNLPDTPDFNSDGNRDLLWHNSTTGEVGYWYMNNTTTTGGVIIATAPLDWKVVGTGDFNKDSKDDLLWRNTSTGEVGYWYMNNTTTTGAAIIGTVPLDWKVVATGDFNKDGKDDLLWQNTNTGQVGYWYMDNTNILGSAIIGTAPLDWKVVGTGDFNKDSKDDLLWQNTNTGQVGYWYMDNTNILGSAIAGTAPVGWNCL